VEDLEVIRKEATQLAAAVDSVAAEADESLTPNPLMVRELQESGLASIMVAGEYGGRFEAVDPLAITLTREILMYTSAHLDSLFAMQGIGSYAIGRAASDRVRSYWLPRVAKMEVHAALALTEPQAGSDLRAINTTVTGQGAELVIDGHKSFITNAGCAGFYVVLAREGDGYSLIFVPADASGVSASVGPRIIAPHVVGDVKFEDVHVPAEYRVGAPGEGFSLALATLATFRVSVAGAAVGLAQAALDEAVAHTATREQFGRPLAELGAVAGILGRGWMEVETARAIAYRAATMAREDPLGNLHMSSIAKVSATEAAGRIADVAVQVMGRFGLISGSKAERLYRGARPLRIYEGGSEVVLDSLARKLLKDYRKKGNESS
jgi:acyl-CoA dehydrogenase